MPQLRAAFAASCLAAVPAVLPAQDPPPAAAAPVRELVVQNLAPFARREGAAVVVPFARGSVPDLPMLHVADTPTVWQPFGARWPDGSLRQALCLFPIEVPALDERRVPLVAGAPAPLPTAAVPMPTARIEFVARLGQRVVRAELPRVADLESNGLRRVELRAGRLGDSGLVGELLVTAWRDQPQAQIDVAVFFSDPRTPAMQLPVDELAVESHGMALLLRHPGRLGIVQQTTDDGSRCVLLQQRAIGDGQGLRRTGVLVPPRSGNARVDDTSMAACTAPLLGATEWRSSGAFGAYGVVPQLPPWLLGDEALRAHLAARHRAFVAGEQPGGDPFGNFPHGLARKADQTGDQYDFGVVKLSLVAASGLPSMLLEAEVSVLQEGCRPVHCYEVDGTPVEPAKHPDWVVWSGRTHWHAGVSKDRLGKTDPAQTFDDYGWTGKDRQHWSSNHLGAFAMLTGAHWARRELANEVRLYLAGETLDPSFSTSNAGAPRGAGRTELAATWMLLATADPRLEQRMNERLDRVYYQQWAGRTLAADRVRTMCVNDPDARMLQGQHRYWNPWQDGIAAVGFGAAWRMTGNRRAKELAEQLACTVVRHGWLLTEQQCDVATAIRWLDGAPFTPEQWPSTDQTLVQWATGTAFAEWAFGAVEIARATAEREHDPALLQKATAIQQRMRAARHRPSLDYPDLGGLDRFADWDAVTWPTK